MLHPTLQELRNAWPVDMANKLIHSTSPYLLQHAHNPVDWHEWSSESLEKARREDKPILVSIGYSACHWCHVMERECFENEKIAAQMNQSFVCIKVDREERPDVDQVYMEAVQVLGINGGWPLNVFLTPEQKPFYGGTYFPPPQWEKVLAGVSDAFSKRRTEVEESSKEIAAHLNRNDLERFASLRDPRKIDEHLPGKIFEVLRSRFDNTYGGMEKAPKFVMPNVWQLLLRYHHAFNDPEALRMVDLTLRKMTEAGLVDCVGGGFARYSVDGRWFAPHFEKMLYDNAQLLTLYAEMYTCAKDPFFADTLRAIVSWLEREMLHPGGGFYSALDADSEGVEGKFYTWTMEEFREVLGTDTEKAAAYFGVTEEGNWEHGRNILMEKSPGSMPMVAEWKVRLLEARSTRIRPGLDDKILAGWNAMTIVGLVDAHLATGDIHLLDLARRCAAFIEREMMEGATLYRSFKNKRGETQGFLEDYAWLIHAYTSFYQATFEEEWLRKAETLCNKVISNFFDTDEKYFHYTSRNAEQLIARKKEIFDNVIPASNSVMSRNLYRLGSLLANEDWKVMAEEMAGKIAALVAKEPTHMANWGMMLLEAIRGLHEVAIVGDDSVSYRAELGKEFTPFAIFMGAKEKSELPLLSDKTMIDGKTAIYVCYNKTCQLPVTKVAEALAQLKHQPPTAKGRGND
jgi:uncharacterized protein YyaL (SSP411 family)